MKHSTLNNLQEEKYFKDVLESCFALICLLIMLVGRLVTPTTQVLAAEACQGPLIFPVFTDRQYLKESAKEMFRALLPTQKSDDCSRTTKSHPLPAQDVRSLAEVLPGPSSEVGPISEISKEALDEAFAALKEDCRIPFDFIYEGCFPRAHAMARTLEDKGIIAGKVFFSGKISLSSKMTKDNISAISHAAVFVFVVDKENQIQPYVIDPSVANNPLPLAEFKKRISASPNSLQMQFTNRFHLEADRQYQEINSHSHPLSDWNSLKGHEAQKAIEAYSQARDLFNEKKCGSMGNVLGGVIGPENPNVVAIKQKCEHTSRSTQN
jgi:hypothetical protein